MNKHRHFDLDISVCILALIVLLLSMGFSLKGGVEDKYIVEQQMLCAGGTGIIYQRYAWYFIKREDMRFMTNKEYQTYCTHAGSIERKPK